MSWDDIAAEVRNLAGEPSTADTVKRAYARFSLGRGRSVYKYKNCGRKKWKMTPEIERFIVQKLKQLRLSSVCTSTELQAAVA